MTWMEAIILGFVQGITEFLPISSTAQLIATQYALGLDIPGLTLEIVLHLASVLAVMLYYRRELVELLTGAWRYCLKRDHQDLGALLYIGYLGVATIITAIIGLAVESQLIDHLKHPAVVAGGLTLTALFLFFLEGFIRKTKEGTLDEKVGWKRAVIIGLAQALAVLPGISRSGATVIASLWLGLKQEYAIRFSFLLAIPVILGSSLLLLRKADQSVIAELGAGPLVLGFIVAFFASWAGIVWLIHFVRTQRLYLFGIYCILLAGVILVFGPDFS